MRPLDAVIVGSGPNGLVAAVTLARAGWRVRVLEAGPTPGGGLRSAELTLPGYLHDVCSAVHPMAIASPALRDLPLPVDWVHPEIGLAHPLDDGSAGAVDRGFALRSLGRDDHAWRRLMRPLARAWDELGDVLVQPIPLPRRDPLALVRFGLSALLPATTLARRRFDTERARALFAGIAAHATVPLESPATAAFGLVLGVAAHAVGWPSPRGGARSLADALVAHLRALGGELETDRRVRALEDVPDARAILFDVTPRQLLAITGDHFRGRYRRALERFRYGPGACKVDWALREPIPWTAAACRKAGTVHVGGTLDEIAAAERATWHGAHPERPFVLVGQQSLADPTRAPEGRHTAWGYCHVPNGSTEDMTAAIEAQVERFAPGFRDVVLARHTRTAAALEAYNPSCVGGDLNGGALDWVQMVVRPALRPVPHSTPDPRLYLCSSSTPPGSGVHGMCGYHAARAALRRLRR